MRDDNEKMQAGPVFGLMIADEALFRRAQNLANATGYQHTSIAPLIAHATHLPSGEDHPQIIIADAVYGRDVIARLKAFYPHCPIIRIDSDPGQQAAMAALRDGADDYICTQDCDAQIAARIAGHARRSPSIEGVCEDDGHLSGTDRWKGDSKAACRIRQMVKRVAPSNSTILIEGETGTGKDVLAVSLHEQSTRNAAPMIAVNCAAIPDALIEGELFGYRKGAFTGAAQSFLGKFALADGGTLFLDEIGEMSLSAQAKLLRVLETREVTPLGSTIARKLDVRIIAATNCDLEQAVESGRFRSDLYYRLAIVRLRLPKLCERPDDIMPIAHSLIGEICRESGFAIPSISADVEHILRAHDWPGNVRELRNALEHALVTSEDPHRLSASDLPQHIRPVSSESSPLWSSATSDGTEREFLLNLLASHSGQKTNAARSLNCSRMTLYRRLERAGIQATDLTARA